MKKLLLVPALLLGLAVPAFAQGTTAQPATTQTQQSPLKLVLEDYLVTKVTNAEGKEVEKLEPDASGALPQQVIEYQLTASNLVKQPITGVQPMLPVPAGTIFVASGTGGATNVTTQYSYDGGKTFGPAPLFKTVQVQENGKTVTKRVEVQPYEYTNVRWNISSLKAEAQQKFVLRVRVK